MELDLDDIIRVANNTGNFGLATGADLSPEALNKIEASGPEFPSPSEITNTVLPELVAGKRGDGVGSVADEASDSVGVESEEKGDEEVVSVPKGLERLLTNTGMGCGVHEQHA